MAVAAADVRSALSLPEHTAGPLNSKARGFQGEPGTTSKARKPDGISRELYSLIGPSQPFLVAQRSKPKLKQKPRFANVQSTTPAPRWELKEFKNSARKDGLRLKHWAKASEDAEADYSFTKYNIENPHYVFSQDEYTKYLDEQPWTKELTDYLFELYKEYDGRWYIIWDRAEFPAECNFDIDDLKDRYYSVCRKLIRNRPWPHDEVSKTQLLNSLSFDKDREKMRKRYLVNLESRTSEQLAEEEALYVEIRRLEQTERRFKKEREELFRTLAGMDSGLPEIVEDDGGPLGVTPEVKSKKRKAGIGLDTDTPITPSASSIGSPLKRVATSPKDAAYDEKHCILRMPDGPSTKAAHTPAFIRSAKIPWLKNNSLQPKIIQAFTELGLSPSRLVMPTRENVAALESLSEAVTAMVETRRHLDKVEYDIEVAKRQLQTRAEGGDEGDGDGDGMDIDEGGGMETDGNEGRGQSIVSARSAGGRGSGRRKAQRSMSISSVDTSVSTRVKRQKRG